jgi:multidrug efflux pump subunit AcrA (membrane-fusion protein)
VSHVHTRVAGWIEELYVDTTGQLVRAGEPLAGIFSQELLSSQTEYLSALRAAESGPPSVVVEAARTRLTVLGMTEEEIRGVEERGEPMRLVTLAAPRSGVVLHRGVSVGTAVDPSTEIVTIADLSQVWVLAEVPESEIAGITSGMTARLDFPASGGPPFPARVAFLYPTLTERTRTLRVRFVVRNPGGSLRPGLYGTADLEVAPRRVLTVPRDAVVDTGLEQHVFVTTSPGGFAPRQVELGVRLGDRVEVTGGLQEGEEIVSSGAFLIDSESRLRASGGMGAGHAGHQAPQSAPATESGETKDEHEEHRD